MISLTRRTCIAVALAALTANAGAQSRPWPTKPVRMVLPSAAGTAPDIIARSVAEKLSIRWGQPVVVDNRPGAGGLIGLTAVKQGAPDSHVFVLAPASVYAMTPFMYKSPNVDLVRDFVPVGLVGVGPMMVAVASDSPAQTLADVVAMARKAPDRFVMATTSQYSLPHLAADLLGKAAGVPLRPVTHTNSGQSISAVIGGDAQALIDGIPPIDAMLKSKRLKAIAVFSERRLESRPDLPTVAETYPALVINGWFGIVAPKGTDPAAIERVNRDLAAVVSLPDVVARFETLGIYARPMSPDQFGAYWNDERIRWEKALVDTGAQPGMGQ